MTTLPALSAPSIAAMAAVSPGSAKAPSPGGQVPSPTTAQQVPSPEVGAPVSIRAYRPEASMVNGTWVPPAIEGAF